MGETTTAGNISCALELPKSFTSPWKVPTAIVPCRGSDAMHVAPTGQPKWSLGGGGGTDADAPFPADFFPKPNMTRAAAVGPRVCVSVPDKKPKKKKKGNLVHGIGTKKDTGPWFKNILHRNMRLDGNYTKARRVPCKSCGKGHENWDHFWKCKKYRPIWKKLCKLMNDTTEGETEEKIHRHYSRKWIYLGIKKDGNAISRGQRASTATYDSMEIHHTETYKIGHRWDTTEENQHREYMETNTEQASDKDKCNTIQNRKTKNTAGSKNGRIQPPEHEQKDRTIRENRGRNRMERNTKNRTSRTKTDQRNIIK